MTQPTATTPADIYISALRQQRDHLEIQIAGLRYQLAAAEAEIDALKARAPLPEDKETQADD